MPNITRGGRMSGVMAYLVSQELAQGGHRHTEPHLVGGDSSIMAWWDDSELGRDAALAIAQELDRPRRVFGTRVTQVVRDAEGARVGARDAHVWHCSLSLRADEGALSDERWAHISEQFVARMGFAGAGAGDAPCRWVAVRHGESSAGNDHVHIVVGLVHEDGRKANVHNDRARAQRVAGELEREHGLVVLESREAGRGSRGHKPAEAARAAREGAPEAPRDSLARTVRACAAAAEDEAQFVRGVRAAGLRVRPRYASGRGDVVVGFSVAHRPPGGQAPVWYGGGRLARDLTLPRLRAQWPDSPAHANAAIAEWQAAKRNQRTAGGEAPTPQFDAAAWERCTAQVAQLREQLRAVPIDDHATWAHVAGQTAGAFAAWSQRVESTPGPLAATADVLARSAQLRAHAVRAPRAPRPSLHGAALLLASAAHEGRGPVAEVALMRQLANTVRALHDAHRAAGELGRAREIADVVRGQLATVHSATPAVGDARAPGDALEAVRTAHQGQPPPRAPGSPVPGALPETPPGPPRPSPTRDTETQR